MEWANFLKKTIGDDVETQETIKNDNKEWVILRPNNSSKGPITSRIKVEE
jgi:hypothetical protein